MRRTAWAMPALAVLLSAWTIGSAAGQAIGSPDAASRAGPKASAEASGSPAASDSVPALQATASGGPGRFPPTAKGILDGKVILVDPGHNGGNFFAAVLEPAS